ncbi:bifunctional phosphoribosylaminoimidazolecarboxamide formyltransferase/inosine monophosphate cyclohydrolase [Longimonas halophila]|uniref:Bifunctional purine biosynthesis protein PurH n=1 Tax=Longimonas halophila TaxID=1469170 RepID=A0A2H3P1U7_9BACT|nr:bifunctional phosphoribosylaminoimidazolecarboxamide formyltransferase/IMP cyclohydrolase [Longimonas halophila]PEN04961.1 bifunctional phosphoribosylaminoimidazolecarboxamide formyltransferase/inosine monophosphate cyclohydrolase [Longimonas halophila]
MPSPTTDAPNAPESPVRIRRALLSVYDKDGVVPLAKALHTHGAELVSTGGTAQALRDADLPVTDVTDVTGAPEMLDGRVKTLHPAIHAGLLARRDEASDLDELKAQGIAPIDLVVGSLYPFQQARHRSDLSPKELLEYIDIGGPTMLRAAAKNYHHVGVVSNTDQYEEVVQALNDHDGALPLPLRRTLAGRAFAATASYDTAIANYLGSVDSDADDALPSPYIAVEGKAQDLRYGENPHQRAALYGTPFSFVKPLHGKALSYNNMIDVHAALALIDEFRDDGPTCAILKHTNPTGVATADTLLHAYERAFATDTKSPFGGIVIVNQALDRATAEAINSIYTEVIIAPEYEEGVLDLLKEKKKRRLLRQTGSLREDPRHQVRSVAGGLLVQDRNPVSAPLNESRAAWSVVTDAEPTAAMWGDMHFAWRVVKHVKSNAILYVRDGRTLGIGAGQMSRVDASELAVRKAAEEDLSLDGAVVASDAFFPFADGLEAAAEHGITGAIQPGGSIRDDEVIAAANAHDIAMVCTGTRHFCH